jgi:FlaA1/EpsC-like NDP-sugar epimerase
VTDDLTRALGRPERELDLSEPLLKLQGKRVLVTGASGALGQPLVETLRRAGVPVVPTDIDTSGVWGCVRMDVTNFQEVLQVVAFHDPDVIINLAASKLAPAGEQDPWHAVHVNTVGVKNLLDMGRPVLQASTCKAADPETAYGASKLISERLVLNYGSSVIRYVNIPECGPSVYTIWRDLPDDVPLPVTNCSRYFMSFREAVGLTIWATSLAPGRYKLNVGRSWQMYEYARNLYPNREHVIVPPRRGDRIAEPKHAACERIEQTSVPYIERIINPCDP